MNYGKLAGNTEQTTTRRRGPGKPWPPGVSGNPSGRPKSKPITDMLSTIFAEDANVEEIRKNVLATLTSKGMAGVILLGHVADRLEGKVEQQIDMNVSGNLSLSDRIAERRKKLKRE